MPMLRKLLRMKLGLLVPLVAILASAMAYLWDPVPLQILRNATFDQFQRWHPRAYAEVPVRIIDIDDESLRRLGQWPWPRTRVAELVSRLQDAEAAVIAFDVIFAEPDRTSPKAMLDLWQVTPSTRRELDRLPDPDEVLGQAIRRGRVVLGFASGQAGAPSAVPTVQAHFAAVIGGGSGGQRCDCVCSGCRWCGQKSAAAGAAGAHAVAFAVCRGVACGPGRSQLHHPNHC
jgi:adenylate cyclase